jgi:hypothetical protein
MQDREIAFAPRGQPSGPGRNPWCFDTHLRENVPINSAASLPQLLWSVHHKSPLTDAGCHTSAGL